MSLVVTDGDGEQNEMRMLQDKLEMSMKVVITLTAQLNELKEQVWTQKRGRGFLVFFVGLFEDMSPRSSPFKVHILCVPKGPSEDAATSASPITNGTV